VGRDDHPRRNGRAGRASRLLPLARPPALSSAAQTSRFQRDLDAGEEQRATTLELFYDLVFVFAVTQVSHLLLADLSWDGAGEATLVLLVAWWAWNYTTWVTNELDPDSPVVRLLLMGIMLATLLMAVAIPDAFGSRGLLFACSYVAIQVGRHAFLTFASARAGTIERERAAYILIWFVASGAFWIAGALVEDEARVALWLVALGIDYFAPVILYRVPGRPKLAPETWDVETAHFAERFQLFVIIALGESVVLIGATTSDLDINAARLTALGLAFAGTAALWWLYFDYVAPIAQRRLELAENRTLLARDGYTYLHVLMIAGIIAWAVGDELVIAHPTDELPTAEIVVLVSGPAIYLLGHVLFRLRIAGTLSWKRLAGALACVAVAALGPVAPGLVLSGLLVAVVVGVIVAERIAEARRRKRGQSSPREQLESEAASGYSPR
jgi:low temperature requirement protein LtrA